ncbi:CPBP family intramembrane glutamic endopeptidase [Planococcus lenghuensis]|uniref:CAAX protease family protein n=1 Tax=Planococcus lenghuensis TaxID=2213202 RepID=A0A1Q2KVC9_9BACL|nr:type II CAAX endopeptidase family protein [Planococcus lenghuensis]AQQ52160.1 CAAX protease family protein [Planococcus lenghuensis]
MAKQYSPRRKRRTALYVLLVYFIAQLSGIFLIIPLHNYFLGQELSAEAARFAAAGWVTFITFGLGLLVIIFLIFRDKRFFDIWQGKESSIWAAIGWGVLGFFLLLVGQSLAAIIEVAFGIEPGSENTASIAMVAAAAPIMIIAVVLFGPILEELIFRRVIFGSLNQTMNFWLATAISALAFAAVHMEFVHLLLYFTTGLILAFLYQKTKRLLTPIIAHVLLNSYVMLIQLNIDRIENFMRQLEEIQRLQ